MSVCKIVTLFTVAYFSPVNQSLLSLIETAMKGR